MKKIIIALFLVCAFGFVNAQNVLTSKNGTPILPEKGDWAIGVSAAPFLDYFGQFLSNKGNSAPAFNFFTGDNSIIGKYFLTDKTAIRARVRIGLMTNTYDGYVRDETSASPFAQQKDKLSVGATNITLGLGMEKRRGKGRLQGYYGAEALIGVAGTRDKYTYGNPITSVYTGPASTNFFNDNNLNNLLNGGKVTEYKTVALLILALEDSLVLNILYYLLSLGGEFGWGIALNASGAGTQTEEYWNGTSVASGSLKFGNGSSFGADTDNLEGNIFLMFHF